MIGIANEHDIIKKNLKIEKISFDIITKGESLQLKGKKKSILYIEYKYVI